MSNTNPEILPSTTTLQAKLIIMSEPTVKPVNSEPTSCSHSEVGDVEKGMPDVQKVRSATEEYPHGIKLFLILISIYMAIFLQALDRTVIATALPRITDDFKAFGDVGWYNGAFLLTISAFQLFFGRVYTFYSPKWVFIILIMIFEIGSTLCGAAPNSIAFIWGRAIAGIGAAGSMNGGITLLIYAVPLDKRALYQGLVGAVFAIASVAGPLLGGVFTSDVTWRWCFYINLPIGALVIIFIFFAVESPPVRQPGLTIRAKVQQLDPLGTFFFLPCIVCLLLALQWGGGTYAWNSARIIILFVFFGVLGLAFIAVQFWRKDAGTVPPHVLGQRSIAAGFWFAFFVGGAFMTAAYYIPVWFQAIKGDSAIQSGISTLPLLLSLTVGSIGTGITVSRVGYYAPAMLICSVLLPIGGGLLSTFKVHTAHPTWIGVQVLLGFGIGVGMQQATLAAQTVLPRKEVPTGVSLMVFAQALGGTIAIAIAQSLLDNRLIALLPHIDGFNPESVVRQGATQLRSSFPKEYLPEVLQVYNKCLTEVYYLVAAFACLSLLGAASMEWRSMKDKNAEKEKEKVSKEREERMTLAKQEKRNKHDVSPQAWGER